MIHQDMVLGLATGKPSTNEVISCGDDGVVALWKWQTNTNDNEDDDADKMIIKLWKGHKKSVNTACYLESTDCVLTGSRDLTLKVWSRDSSEARASLQGHTMNISTVAAPKTNDSSNNVAVSGSRDYTVRVWDLETQACTTQSKISRNVVTSCSFIPGENSVFLQGSEDLTIRLWDTRAMEAPVEVLRGHSSNIPLSMDISADGLYFATGSKGFDGVGCEVHWWDRRMGKVLRELSGHSMAVTGVCCHDGLISTASTDTSVRLWDVKEAPAGEECICVEGLASEGQARPASALCSLAGSTKDAIVGADIDGHIQIWELDAQRKEMHLKAATQ